MGREGKKWKWDEIKKRCRWNKKELGNVERKKREKRKRNEKAKTKVKSGQYIKKF